MAEVTEAAIKSAKFYKHVVQSVEKFIQKVSFDWFLVVSTASWTIKLDESRKLNN